MNILDRLLPRARLVEVDGVDVIAEPARAWHAIRHLDLAESAVARVLFGIRTRGPTSLSVDALASTPERPGFQILIDEPPSAFAVGAIGKVWQLDIPFRHVTDAAAFAAFDEPGEVKVAWAVRIEPLARGARVVVEVRVDAKDDATWRKFRAYFAFIGPASRLIRRLMLARLARQLGRPGADDDERTLPGDELLDTHEQITSAITIHARPEAIWPWLVQMGCDRGGFYSVDLLDNGGHPSAREIHPEWQELRVGDTISARPGEKGGFEVLRIDPLRVLVLGGETREDDSWWKATWAFVLEPLDDTRTRLVVRARAACAGMSLHLAWIRPVHRFMEAVQLRNIARRAAA